MQRQTPRAAEAGVETASITRGHRSPSKTLTEGSIGRPGMLLSRLPVHPRGAPNSGRPGTGVPRVPREGHDKEKASCGEWMGWMEKPRFVSMYRSWLSSCPHPPPHTHTHTFCSTQGMVWRRKVQTFLSEPLSRGDVCALSCSISRAAYTSHPPRVRYGPPFRRAAATSCPSWPCGN